MPRTVGLREIALLVALSLCWGTAFMWIKVAVDAVPPLTIAATRLLLGGLALAALARALGLGVRLTRRRAVVYALVGLLGNALPFTLIGVGEQTVASGIAAILMGAAPLITLVLAHHFVESERMTPRRVAGVAIGLVGIVVLVGVDALAGLGARLGGQLALLAAAAGYATANVVATRVTGDPPLASAAAVTVAGALWAVPASLVVDQPWTLAPAWSDIGALLILSFIASALGNLIFFVLIGAAGPNFASLVNYLVPVVGVFAGALLLAESLGWQAFAALALIFAGIAVSRRRPAPPGAQSPSPSTSAIE